MVFDKNVWRKQKVRFSLIFPALQRTGPGPYEPIRAHMDPARILDEREKFRKNNFFYITHFHQKIIVFDLHIKFFDSFDVFFRFLTEICFRTVMKLPQKASSRTKPCRFWYLRHPALSNTLAHCDGLCSSARNYECWLWKV